MYLEKGEMITVQFDNDALMLVMEGLGELPEKKSGVFKVNLHHAVVQIVNQRNAARAAEGVKLPDTKPNRATRRAAAAAAKAEPPPIAVPAAPVPAPKIKTKKKTTRAKK